MGLILTLKACFKKKQIFTIYRLNFFFVRHLALALKTASYTPCVRFIQLAGRASAVRVGLKNNARNRRLLTVFVKFYLVTSDRQNLTKW